VDTGYFLADEQTAHGRLRPDIVTKNDWVLKAYDQFPVDVLNVSSYDFRYFGDAFAKTALARLAETEPLFGRMISANIVDERRGDSPALPPFIIREVPSRQKGAKPVRIAFVGLTESLPAAPAGFRFTDPAAAARRTLPEARKLADLVVVLAKVTSQAEVVRIAREAPGIDIMIDGNSRSLEDSFTPPIYVGPTLVVFTPFETRMIGELRFYRSAQGKFSTKQRFIALDEMLVPEDPAAKQVVDAATSAESETRRKSRELLESWLVSSRLRATARTQPGTDSSGLGASPSFVSSSTCSQCHVDQYLKWANTAHGHATDPLLSRELEVSASCLECHATGSKPATATGKLELAQLQNVQCEQCHGPGSIHVAKPGKGYGLVADIKTICANCHTSETSPDFDLQAAWAKIKH
jgi:Cytochrome c554 and c-prime